MAIVADERCKKMKVSHETFFLTVFSSALIDALRPKDLAGSSRRREPLYNETFRRRHIDLDSHAVCFTSIEKTFI